jgi:hypothetical protein
MSRENPYEDVSNEELLNKLEGAEMFATLLDSPEWACFREAWRRISQEADKKLMLVDPTNASQIMQLQYAKRFYEHVLQTTINQMHDVADLAYHEAKERGLLNHFVEKIRAKLTMTPRAKVLK